jgi:FtsH-binding integral membrane protein
MQWPSDSGEHLRALNEGLAIQSRGTARNREGFVDNQTAWAGYEVAKTADEGIRGRNDVKEHKLWSIGERLERSNFGQSTRELPTSLLSTVYGLLAFSMAFTAAGIIAGYSMGPGTLWLAFLAQLGLVFAIAAWREVEYLNLVLLYSFSAATGLMLGPLIAQLANVGMSDLLVQAALATAGVTGCMFFIGRRIEQDLYSWQPLLFAGLLVFLGLNVVNLLFFSTPFAHVLMSFAGVMLFSAYLVIDVNRIRHVENTMGNAVIICLDIYLDIVNLFLNILQILIELAGEGD